MKNTIHQSNLKKPFKAKILPIQKSPKIILTELPPLALYVHFPWCIQKCPYCDFNSHSTRNNIIPEERYITALISDIETALPTIWGRRIYSIFFGGGTPSLFTPKGFDKLMSSLRSILPIYGDIEITMEANPSTVDQTRFKEFHESGVNRLSLGIQSFQDQKLSILGRSHNGDDAKKAIEVALSIYDNVNLDLIYGLPNQTMKDFESDMLNALSYKTKHLSFYHLTIEPNTFFARYPPIVPNDDAVDIMQEILSTSLSKEGFLQYEVSAFAKKEQECKHNLNYWTFGDYLGIGAGAHSKISFLNKEKKIKVLRESRWKHPQKYMDCSINKQPVEAHHEVASADLIFEYMLNTLRLNQGFLVNDFVQKTGLPHTTIFPTIRKAITQGLLMKKTGFFHQARIVPTDYGKRFLNDLQQMFLPERPIENHKSCFFHQSTISSP